MRTSLKSHILWRRDKASLIIEKIISSRLTNSKITYKKDDGENGYINIGMYYCYQIVSTEMKMFIAQYAQCSILNYQFSSLSIFTYQLLIFDKILD